MKDKKIRKIINEAYKEPKISFDEWREIHEEDLKLQQKVQEFAPVQETEVSINSESTLIKRNKGGFVATISSSVIIFVVAAILLLVLLFPKGAAPGLPIIKEYGANDAVGISINSEEYLLISNIDKINIVKAEGIESINKIVPKDNEDLTLGYLSKKIIYGVFIGEDIFGYQFDSFVRLYEKYFFENAADFEDLTKEYVFKNQKYKYKIKNYAEVATAYISYEKNNISYYFTIKAFEDMCEINERSVNIFIENVIA